MRSSGQTTSNGIQRARIRAHLDRSALPRPLSRKLPGGHGMLVTCRRNSTTGSLSLSLPACTSSSSQKRSWSITRLSSET